MISLLQAHERVIMRTWQCVCWMEEEEEREVENSDEQVHAVRLEQSVCGCGMLSQVLILACLWLIKHAGCLKLAWHSQLAAGSELACNSQLVGGSELAYKSQLTGSFELACKSQLTGGFELACQSQLTGGFELASKSQLVGGSKRVIMRTWWACL